MSRPIVFPSPYRARLAEAGLWPLPTGCRAAPGLRLLPRRCSDETLFTGASKLGGCPDLPEGFVWPATAGRLLAFLGQVNLEAAAGYACSRVLPGRGLLAFFYDYEESPWGYDPQERGGWQVLYFPIVQDLVRTRPGDDERHQSQFMACTVTFQETVRVTDFEPDEVLMSQAFAGPIWLEFDNCLNPSGKDLAHRLLGLPDAIQSSDMDLECQLASHGIYLGDADAYRSKVAQTLAPGAADWQLLLQLDSDADAGMMWGDMGRLYFWKSKQDLAAGDFTKVWVILQCC